MIVSYAVLEYLTASESREDGEHISWSIVDEAWQLPNAGKCFINHKTTLVVVVGRRLDMPDQSNLSSPSRACLDSTQSHSPLPRLRRLALSRALTNQSPSRPIPVVHDLRLLLDRSETSPQRTSRFVISGSCQLGQSAFISGRSYLAGTRRDGPGT